MATNRHPLPPSPRRPAWDSLHRSILVVDIEGYSRPRRTNLIRGRLRDTLYLLLTNAMGSLGIAGQYEPPKDEGDGALVLFHPEVPKNRLLFPLIAELAEGLASYNAAVTSREQLRQGIVKHELAGIDPSTYNPIDVRVKSKLVKAWLHVPDADAASGRQRTRGRRTKQPITPSGVAGR